MRLSWLFPAGLVLFVAASCDEEALTPSEPLPNSKSGVGGDGGAGGGVTGGSGACDGAGATIEALGEPNKLLLRGMIATPINLIDGEVLIVGNMIKCVAENCAGDPAAAGASIVNTNGIILPGLIDTHNHILFDIFDGDDWLPMMAYGNHDQWPNEERYGAMVDTKQYLNGEDNSPVNYACELLKYGEMKGLIAGTTSIVGSPGAVNRGCYGSLSRTIDQSANDLDADKIQTATIFPSNSAADGVCANFADGDTDAYVIHVAEGVDATAFGEWDDLLNISTVPECLINPKTTIVHGTALSPTELTIMAQNGMSLSWSPASNVALYGGGTDLTKTTNIPAALEAGVNIALSPDWSMGGSQNLLDELRYADMVDNTMWGDILTPKMLTEMVTINAAIALGLEGQIGSVGVNRRADLMVIRGNPEDPYGSLLAATPKDVTLVLVDGRVSYGDNNLVGIAPTDPGCETLDICCATKFACVAEPSLEADDKLDQTFATISSTLNEALSAYDAMNLSQWDFAPITPVVKCE